MSTDPHQKDSTRPEPGKKEADSLRKDLSFTQVTASALAAVSASVAASYFNLIGTIIGAAIISVVATVGSALYKHSLDRSKAALKNAAEVVPWTPRQMAERRAAVASSAAKNQSGTSPQKITSVRADTDETRVVNGQDTVTHTLEMPALRSEDTVDTVETPAKKAAPKALNWRHIAAAVATVFVITVGAITTVELVGGAPLSSLLWGKDDKGGTSLGGVLGGENSGDKKMSPKPNKPTTQVPVQSENPGDGSTPSPTSTPTPTPEPTPTLTPTPTQTPTPTPTTSLSPSPTPLPG